MLLEQSATSSGTAFIDPGAHNVERHKRPPRPRSPRSKPMSRPLDSATTSTTHDSYGDPAFTHYKMPKHGPPPPKEGAWNKPEFSTGGDVADVVFGYGPTNASGERQHYTPRQRLHPSHQRIFQQVTEGTAGGNAPLAHARLIRMSQGELVHAHGQSRKSTHPTMAKPGVGTNQYGAFGSNHLEEGSGMVVKDVVANEAWGIEAPHLGRVNVPGCAIHNDNFVGVSLHVSPSAKVYKEHDENPHRREFPHHAAERRFTFSGSQASALVQPEDDPRADRSHPPANEGSGASTPRDSRAIYDIARSRANFVGNTMEITPGMSERGIFTGAHRSKGLAHVELGHLKEQSSHFKVGSPLNYSLVPPYAEEHRAAGMLPTQVPPSPEAVWERTHDESASEDEDGGVLDPLRHGRRAGSPTPMLAPELGVHGVQSREHFGEFDRRHRPAKHADSSHSSDGLDDGGGGQIAAQGRRHFNGSSAAEGSNAIDSWRGVAAAGTGARSGLPIDGRRRSQVALSGSLTGAAPNQLASSLTDGRDEVHYRSSDTVNKYAAARRSSFSGSQASALTGLVEHGSDVRPARPHSAPTQLDVARSRLGRTPNQLARRLSHSGSATAALLGARPLPPLPAVPTMVERVPEPYATFTDKPPSPRYYQKVASPYATFDDPPQPGWLREGSTPPFAIETDNRIAGASEDVINGRQRQIKTAARRQSFAGSAAAALVEFHPETLSPRAMAKMMQRNAPEHKQRRHFPKEEKRNRRGSLSSSMGGELAGALTPRPGADNAPAGQRVPRRGIDMELGKRTSDRRMSDFHTSMLAIGVDRPESSALVEQREQAENLGRRGSMMLQHWREQDMREMLARQEAARIVVAPREETKEVADKKGRRMSCRGPVKGAHEGGRVRHTTDSSMMNAVLFNR